MNPPCWVPGCESRASVWPVCMPSRRSTDAAGTEHAYLCEPHRKIYITPDSIYELRDAWQVVRALRNEATRRA
jgi:hypothetical protein